MSLLVFERRERGSALVPAIVMVILMLGVTGAYIALTLARSGEQQFHVERERAMRTLEGAVGIKVQQLVKNAANVQLLGTASGDVRYAVLAVPVVGVAAPTYKIGGYAKDGKTDARILVTVQQQMDPIQGSLRGGVTAYSNTDFSGSIVIDGEDYNIADTAIVGAGTYGISSVGGVNLSGSSSAGGNGSSPTSTETTQNREENAVWGTGVDTNGNGVIDPNEKAYPTSADQVLNLSEGKLKTMAQSTGTYFANATQWNAYLAAHASVLPGGVVFDLDFDPAGMDINFPDTYNDPPSVFVNHVRDPDASNPADPAGIATLGNLHGKFRGLMIVDGIRHFNGGFNIVGGIFSLAGQQYGNVFGNGNATIHYSSGVLGNLPRAARDGSPFKVLAWVEQGSDLTLSPVTDCVTAVTNMAYSENVSQMSPQ